MSAKNLHASSLATRAAARAPAAPDPDPADTAQGGTLRRWIDALSLSFRDPRAWAHTEWAETRCEEGQVGNPWGPTVLDDTPHGTAASPHDAAPH